jgi:hypothetical protein
MNKFLTLSTLAICVATGYAQENYQTSWTGHKNVLVNTSGVQGGAGVAANVADFPVLVRLTPNDSAIFLQAKAGGADLRFSTPNNLTRLSHQIESWNATSRTAAIWVRMDTVYGNTNGQYFRMHWGNAGAADSSSGPQVFRTTQGFQAVWHMNGAGDASDESDATANAFTGSQANSPFAVAGTIAGARQFTGSQYFNTTGTESGPLNFAYNSYFTISAWINPVELAAHGVIVSKHDRQYAMKLDANNNLEFFEFGSGIGWNAVNAFADQGTWRHAVGIQRGFDAELYLDGVRVDFGIVSTASTNNRQEAIQVVIGAEPTSATAFRRYFIGVLDELRMANTARSAEWVKLEYENQKAGATMVQLLDTVPVSISPKLLATEAGFTAKASGNGLVFRIQDQGAHKARVTLVDMYGRTVWSRLSDIRNAQAVSWDGRTTSGQSASQGVYAARVTLLDAHNKVMRVLDRKVPLTR